MSFNLFVSTVSHIQKDFTNERAYRTRPLSVEDMLSNRRLSSVRAKVEHPFQVIKVRFNHRKVRYRGLEKNTAQLFSLFGLANLVLAKRYLQRTAG